MCESFGLAFYLANSWLALWFYSNTGIIWQIFLFFIQFKNHPLTLSSGVDTLNVKALPNNRSFFSTVHRVQGCESLWVIKCFEYICQRVIERKWELCINILSKNYRPKQVYLAWGIDLAVALWDASTYCSFFLSGE